MAWLKRIGARLLKRKINSSQLTVNNALSNEGETSSENKTNSDEEEQRYRIKKLQLETTILSYQSKPGYIRLLRLQSAASIASFVTAGVAVAALCASSWQWFSTQQQSRDDKINERLDAALTRLSNQTPAGRLTAVVALRSFLEEPDQRIHYQVLRVYTSTLSIEDSPTVRNAIVSSLETINTRQVSVQTLQAALSNLVAEDRDMIKEGRLGSLHEEKELALDREVSARADSVVRAIVVLLRAGCTEKNFSGLYLEGADFHGLDLSHAKFDNAYLSEANFEGALLNDASFDHADINYANFSGGHLARAQLTEKGPGYNPLYVELERNTRHFNSRQSTKEVVFAPMPDFTNADLRDADFTGLPILPIVEKDSKLTFDVDDPKFKGATLTGTDFRRAVVFGVAQERNGLGLPFEVEKSAALLHSFDNNALVLFFAGISPEKPAARTDVTWDNSSVQNLFEGANTSGAKFDDSFRVWAGL